MDAFSLIFILLIHILAVVILIHYIKGLVVLSGEVESIPQKVAVICLGSVVVFGLLACGFYFDKILLDSLSHLV